MAAFEKGFLPTDVMNDEPQSYGKWKPKNIYNQYRGNLTLEEALAYSSNTITVKLLHKVGIGHLLKLVRRLGINTRLARNLTLALGSGEVTLFDLTAAYGVIANRGYEIYPHGVVEIRDKATNELLYQAGLPHRKKLLDDDTIRYMDQLLTSAVNYGTSKRSRLNNNIPSAGKSGTSQNYRDGWFIGYVKRQKGPITGIWLGNDDDTPTKGVVGGTIPSESWKMYHDMWITPLPEERDYTPVPISVDNNVMIIKEETPAAEGTSDGIDQVLSLIQSSNPEEDIEITPESIEEEELE
jgi:penicillin-binding protein 1A